jgi:preprotein translocase subunit SecG
MGGSVKAVAASATLHCLTGCAIGEIVGLLVGTALGMANLATIALSIGLAFVFGFSLSMLPLLKAQLTVWTALRVVLAADTLSIVTMEIVDNLVMLVVPGAMNAGLVNPIFWGSMALSLVVAFCAAFPVNRVLLQRGKGHALTHRYHAGTETITGPRRFIPSFGPRALAATIAAFMLGGLVVSIAAQRSQVPGASLGTSVPATTTDHG